MQFPLKSIAAAGALVLASAAALAAPPPVPQPFVLPSGPVPNPETGNGGLIVSAYDSVRGVSLVEYLGVTLDQFLPGDANATPEAGVSLDFGTLTSWNTVFGASDSANIHYTVTAADFTTNSVSDTYIGKRLAITLDPAGSVIPMRNTVMSNVITNERSFIATNIDGPSGCNGVNPCLALSSSDGGYAGGANWGDRLGTGSGVIASASVNNAIGFYYIAANSNSGLATTAATVAYANSTGSAQWLLTSSGHLTYTLAGAPAPVPLPAAVWLLLSGLGGLGVVSRRRAIA